MGNYKLHIITAILIGLVGLLVLSYFKSITFLDMLFGMGIVITYACLPDVDLPNTKINALFQITALTSIIIFTILKINTAVIWLAGLLILVRMAGHRGIVHSILIGILASAPLLYFNFYFFWFGVVGYISHLTVDRKVHLI